MEQLVSSAGFAASATDIVDLLLRLLDGLALDVAEKRFVVGTGSTVVFSVSPSPSSSTQKMISQQLQAP